MEVAVAAEEEADAEEEAAVEGWGDGGGGSVGGERGSFDAMIGGGGEASRIVFDVIFLVLLPLLLMRLPLLLLMGVVLSVGDAIVKGGGIWLGRR